MLSVRNTPHSLAAFLRQADPLSFFNIRMQLIGISGWKILAKMGTPAFFPGKCALMNQTSDGEQVGLLRDTGERFQAGSKSVGIANNSCMTPGDVANNIALLGRL